MPVIKFVKEKKEIEVAAGANLRREAIKAGISLYRGFNGWGAKLNQVVNCHGLGMCGSCRVLVTKGMKNTSPMGSLEKMKFCIPFPDPMPSMAYIDNEDTMRLACLTEVHGDIDVETGPNLDLFGENFFS